MSGTTITALNRSLQTTMEWIKTIQDELGWEDEDRTYNAIKAVLHTLRDRMPLEESAKFAAQLPMIMRGVYYDQYNPTVQPTKLRTRDEFLEEVRNKFPDPSFSPEESMRGVMMGLERRIGRDSVEKIALNFPESIRDLVQGEFVRC